ncbi:FadR/GntR family transcriptional regulator [Denitrobaculum tricleocarpae]|uniref:FadR family transcriptional regulator n=1 Tax=Denitrobaculum tricleocarpae TaxID=2591009 RepID=A0A545TQ23_9PROT|nr:FadR/GntR family transcriptional regulator [Denitrobaculum tricleocarpae]TQV79326.1 FadR family transcriptional regulator [Denitrobaculum tricleocarpae]
MGGIGFYDLKQAPGPAPSLATDMARDLGRRILGGGYEPGRLVEDEGALAMRYHVSRSVVRDAVKILVGKGLLEVRRGVGTRVRPRGSWGLLDDDVLDWYQSAAPDRGFLRQLMEARRMFEPKAARWAAERASDAEKSGIETAVKRMEEERGSVEDFVLADASFHGAILRAAQNEFLIAMEGMIYSALLSSIRLTNKDPRENEASIPFHRRVYEAIATGDGPLAEAVMEQLLSDANERLERELEMGASR